MAGPEPAIFLLLNWMLLFAFFAYLHHRWQGGANGDPDRPSTPTPQSTPSHTPSVASGSRSNIECELCGAENNPEYTYCWNCLAELDRPRM